jgi:hypothetical protein
MIKFRNQFFDKQLNNFILIIISMGSPYAMAQISNSEKDSIYIHQVEEATEKHKVLHAEPLYIDLIRDLGARKGEKEWNVGFGMSNGSSVDSYEALIEYEWAPIDRLGLEVELPFSIHVPLQGGSADSVSGSGLNSLKFATQWSFWVHEKTASSMALGYIHEFNLSSFREFSAPFFSGNTFNPFFIAAKRWGNNFHTLIYTGPVIEQHYGKAHWHFTYDIHSSMHYMISGTRNFVGIEVNQRIEQGVLNTKFRPQLRLGIAPNLLLGILVGIPTRRSDGMNAFLRLIWEPPHSSKILKPRSVH